MFCVTPPQLQEGPFSPPPSASPVCLAHARRNAETSSRGHGPTRPFSGMPGPRALKAPHRSLLTVAQYRVGIWRTLYRRWIASDCDVSRAAFVAKFAREPAHVCNVVVASHIDVARSRCTTHCDMRFLSIARDNDASHIVLTRLFV